MTEIKKDGDAAAHAPKSGSDAGKPDTPETGAPSEKQDAKELRRGRERLSIHFGRGYEFRQRRIGFHRTLVHVSTTSNHLSVAIASIATTTAPSKT